MRLWRQLQLAEVYLSFSAFTSKLFVLSKRKVTPPLSYNMTKIEWSQNAKSTIKVNFEVTLSLQKPSQLVKLPNKPVSQSCTAHTHTLKVDLIMNLANYPTKTQYNASLFYLGKRRTWRFIFLNQDCCIFFCPRYFSFLINPQRFKSDTIATFWTKFRVVFFFSVFVFCFFCFFFFCLFWNFLGL